MRVVSERVQAKELPISFRRGIADDVEVTVIVQTGGYGKEVAGAFRELSDGISQRVRDAAIPDGDLQEILDDMGLKIDVKDLERNVK